MAKDEAIYRFRSASPLQRVKIIEQGFPAEAVRELASDMDISLADLSSIVGPRRTLQRRLEKGAKLPTAESDRLARFILVFDLATAVLGDKASAIAWLTTAKRRFDGERPLELLRTDVGTRLVEDVLEQARHGFTA